MGAPSLLPLHDAGSDHPTRALKRALAFPLSSQISARSWRALPSIPPRPHALSRNKGSLEIPGLTAGFVVQAGIASRDKLEFFRQRLDLDRCSQRGFVQFGHVAILLGHRD